MSFGSAFHAGLSIVLISVVDGWISGGLPQVMVNVPILLVPGDLGPME
jgi:hypothetical protein